MHQKFKLAFYSYSYSYFSQLKIVTENELYGKW